MHQFPTITGISSSNGTVLHNTFSKEGRGDSRGLGKAVSESPSTLLMQIGWLWGRWITCFPDCVSARISSYALTERVSVTHTQILNLSFCSSCNLHKRSETMFAYRSFLPFLPFEAIIILLTIYDKVLRQRIKLFSNCSLIWKVEDLKGFESLWICIIKQKFAIDNIFHKIETFAGKS